VSASRSHLGHVISLNQLRRGHVAVAAALLVLLLGLVLTPDVLRQWQLRSEQRIGRAQFNALFYEHPASRPDAGRVVSTYFDLCLHRQLWFGTILCLHLNDQASARAALLDDPRTTYAILAPPQVAQWFPDGSFAEQYREVFTREGFTLYQRR
jgi:hypothetical protein